MGKNKVNQTATGAAAMRMMELFSPKDLRLFEDHLARDLLDQPLKFIMDLMRFKSIREWCIKMREKRVPGVLGGIICRTRYIDDALQSAIKSGMENIVILGAGLDSRPYRIPGINKTKVFEVDTPSVLDYKKQRIEKILGSLPSHVTYVPINFNNQTLDETLEPKGLDISRPTFFIWEGVTQYITAEAIDSTLKYISKTSPGSRAVFTYIIKSVIEGTSNLEGANVLTRMINKTKNPWIYGIEPTKTAEFLQKYNLSLIEDIGASYYQKKYLKPIGRDLNVFEIERIALAEVVGDQ
ncbi:MAG: SAM-dependent methyltransferase [Candidatus Eremiobacteraeota bacterium]|nr:SAM-dependent methyltransferase [Candidatus Eremiobacteraeota bacterium]